MRRVAAWFVLTMGLVLPATSAGAQTTPRCYPPPCASAAAAATATLAPASDPPPVVGLVPSGAADRSPVPFVAAGLVAVTGSLTVVALRRRQQIGRRDGRPPRRPVLVPVRTAGKPALSEAQAALR